MTSQKFNRLFYGTEVIMNETDSNFKALNVSCWTVKKTSGDLWLESFAEVSCHNPQLHKYAPCQKAVTKGVMKDINID